MVAEAPETDHRRAGFVPQGRVRGTCPPTRGGGTGDAPPPHTEAMIAIIGGLATAVLWATTLIVSSRAARLIGAWSTLAWVMLVGLLVAVPLLVLGGGTVSLARHSSGEPCEKERSIVPIGTSFAHRRADASLVA